jgi:GNAT superfamily N-acetyltransferase
MPADIVAEVEGKFGPPDGCLLLAYDPDTPEKVIGTAGYVKLQAGLCEASRVVVGWPYQKKGIGRGLMAALMAEARLAGYHTMWIRIPADTTALMEFFTRLGFYQLSYETGPRSTLVLFETALTRSGDGSPSG